VNNHTLRDISITTDLLFRITISLQTAPSGTHGNLAFFDICQCTVISNLDLQHSWHYLPWILTKQIRCQGGAKISKAYSQGILPGSYLCL